MKGRVAQSTRDDVIMSLKRYTDYSEVYKEANAAKDDVSRKRLELEIMEEDVHCWGLSTTQLFHIIKACRLVDHSQLSKNLKIRGAPFAACIIG